MSILDKHRKLIDFLLSAVTAAAQTDKELTAATIPFHFTSFFETEAFRKHLGMDQLKKSAIMNIPGHDMAVAKTIQACLLILQLQELPGANGLKALRVEVKKDYSKVRSRDLMKDVEKSLQLHN